IYLKYGDLHRDCFYPPLTTTEQWADRRTMVTEALLQAVPFFRTNIFTHGLEFQTLFDRGRTIIYNNYFGFRYGQAELKFINDST
ncbi:hypothetical protein ACI3PL_26980, partial [Lacticaseibacillus paracasei]